ncbi:MAG: PAS domain-containing protein [Flavobacteriales bacterium]|nr:PAS domain-containing protein [Flavobacteriales bacterium]
MGNDEAERITGMPHDGLVGRRLLDVMPHCGIDGSLEEFIKVADSGVSYMAERRTGINGLDHWQSTHAVRLSDGFAVTFTDITERLRAGGSTKRPHVCRSPMASPRTVAHYATR